MAMTGQKTSLTISGRSLSSARLILIPPSTTQFEWGIPQATPIRLKSMYAKRHPQLTERFGQTPPERARISPTAESQTEMPSAPKPPPLESWHYDPQLFRKWPQMLIESRGEGEDIREHAEVNE